MRRLVYGLLGLAVLGMLVLGPRRAVSEVRSQWKELSRECREGWQDGRSYSHAELERSLREVSAERDAALAEKAMAQRVLEIIAQDQRALVGDAQGAAPNSARTAELAATAEHYASRLAAAERQLEQLEAESQVLAEIESVWLVERERQIRESRAIEAERRALERGEALLDLMRQSGVELPAQEAKPEPSSAKEAREWRLRQSYEIRAAVKSLLER